jgi:hypothetical protein
MAKPVWLVCLLALFALDLNAAVVINEIMYDPAGTDTGYEWIELYNNGDADIDLEGAKIQAGGAVFADIFVLPHYVLRAGRFVLIGEQNISQAVFITSLAMQNGGDTTDGVRFISADGSYTDTVLYDSPNSNGLPDDSGNPGTQTAEDVAAGSSLARVADGWDTDNCETDFRAETNPTPGLPNHTPVDYALSEVQIMFDDYVASGLQCTIRNNSWAYSDTLQVRLEVRLNGIVINSFALEPIMPWQELDFLQGIGILTTTTGSLQVEVVVYNDANPADNIWVKQLGSADPESSIVINEILYNPDTGNQEWVEIHIPPQFCFQQQLTIEDQAGNSEDFVLTYMSLPYLVLCRDPALLQSRYPDCPAAAIVQVNSLPAMNNEGDALFLKNAGGTVIDSMSYVGNANKKDVSLERYINPDSTVIWHYCYNAVKGTPGQLNSQPPPPSELPVGKVKLVGSPFNPLIGESIKLQYNFRDENNTLDCVVYDLKGIKRHTIASGLKTESSGELTWDGRDRQGKTLERGIYIILVEARNSLGHYFLRKQLTVVLATK